MMKIFIGIIIGFVLAFIVFFGGKGFVGDWICVGGQDDRPVSEMKKFVPAFHGEGVLEESSEIGDSSNPDWWLNSGAYFYWKDGIARTIFGELASTSMWKSEYARSLPEDSDQGAHPQNLFRIVTRDVWKNFTQSAYFKIRKIHLSDSGERRESNGLLFFNRFQDSDNLYYTGIRVDGYVVVKKKIGGAYHTIRDKKYMTDATYNRETMPNLLPLETWIGLKSVVEDTTDGSVRIRVYVDVGKTHNWDLVLDVFDPHDAPIGGSLFFEAGHAGIRTDFMDVEFSDYSIIEKS